jgi:hypothetical protein
LSTIICRGELPTTQHYRPEEEEKTITAADFEPSALNSSPPLIKRKPNLLAKLG